MEDLSEETILEKVERMQGDLITHATGGHFDGSDPAYKKLRSELQDQAEVWKKLPEFVRRCRDLGQFWQFIAKKYGKYADRRDFLWDSCLRLAGRAKKSTKGGAGTATTCR